MEDSQYNTLKSSLSTVPAKALNYSCRLILSSNLGIKQLLTSKKGYARDYRGFAELMGFQFSETKKFEQCDDPTLKILEAWETHPDATLDKLIDFLEEMDRYDVIEAIVPSIEKDGIAFKQSQQKQQNQSLIENPIQVPEVSSCPVSVSSSMCCIEREVVCIEREVLTRHDLLTGENTIYDVYVSYDDTSAEDSRFVKRLADLLESPDIGLTLFIHGRDMLAGSSELESNIEMIKNRCKKMLVILTNDFIKSPQCAFQIRLAASLSLDTIYEDTPNPFGRWFRKILRAIDGPVTWVRETIVKPNQQHYPYYHRRYQRVPTIDECYEGDVVCMWEANEQYKRDMEVDGAIVSLLRRRMHDCYTYEGHERHDRCKKVKDDYEEADYNYLVKYGDLGAYPHVFFCYMKQKHRMVYERRKAAGTWDPTRAESFKF